MTTSITLRIYETPKISKNFPFGKMATIQGNASKYLIFITPQKPRKIKAFRNLMVNEPTVFRVEAVITTSIFLRIILTSYILTLIFIFVKWVIILYSKFLFL